MYCIWHIHNLGIFRTLFIQVYADIFKHIHQYKHIFTRIEALLRHIQAYSGRISTLCNSGIFKILPFQALEYSELKAYSKPSETFTRYIQNPAIVKTVYPGIIREHSETCITRVYADPWHIWDPGMFRTLS